LISLTEAEAIASAPQNCGGDLAQLLAILEYFHGLLELKGEKGADRSFEKQQLIDGEALAKSLARHFRSAKEWI